MDTNLLKQFCVIAETGSLTKAAQLLFITHSGLSKSMKLLQEELQCSLMQPAGRGLTLTEEGINIYRHAKELLAQEDKLIASVKVNHEPKSFRIGTVEIFILPLIDELTNPIFVTNKTTILDLEPGQIETMLAQHQLDAGITYAPYPMPNIDITEICTYRLGCYYTNPDFKSMKFQELPFVVPAQGQLNNPLNIRERDGWVESLYPRYKKYEANLLSTALELTMNGLCAIHIPDFIARKINETGKHNALLIEHEFSMDKSAEQRVFLLKRTDQTEDKTYTQLRNMVMQMIKQA